MPYLTRRHLLQTSGTAAGAILVGACTQPSGTADDSGDTAPGDAASQTSGQRDEPLADVADLSDTPMPVVDPETGDQAFLVKGLNGVTMLSAICSHMGCAVAWTAAKDEFVCPCHGAVYDASGDVVGGPAPNALTRLPVTVRRGEVYRR